MRQWPAGRFPFHPSFYLEGLLTGHSQFRLSPNFASQYSILESIHRDSPTLKSWHGERLYIASRRLLQALPTELHLFSCFEGLESSRQKRFHADKFHSTELERLIWDYENILSGVELRRPERSMLNLRADYSPVATMRSQHARPLASVLDLRRPSSPEDTPSASTHEINAFLRESLALESAKCLPAIKGPYQVLRQRRKRHWRPLMK